MWGGLGTSAGTHRAARHDLLGHPWGWAGPSVSRHTLDWPWHLLEDSDISAALGISVTSSQPSSSA